MPSQPKQAKKAKKVAKAAKKERSDVDTKIFDWGLRLDELIVDWRYSSDGFLEQFGRPQEGP